MTVHEGTLLCGRYRLEKLIGRGGTADVYRAFDQDRQATVAVKVLHHHLAADPDFVRRFRGEAEALAVLDHPNIVRLYGFEQTDGEIFIVMDYVAGTTLREHLAARRGPSELREATRILHDLCGALYYAHRKGIVHQDLKPGNIILKPDGSAMLTDFGIAHALGSAGAADVGMGTPAYISPEQIRGDAAGAQSDIYSLGVVLYEIVAGRRPFTGGEAGLTETTTTGRLHEAHLWLRPADPRSNNPQLPADISNIILRALEKRTKDRWLDVLSLRLAWDSAVAVHEPKDNDRPAAAAAPTPAKPRRAAWIGLLAAGIVTALAAVGFIALTLVQNGALNASAPPVASRVATIAAVSTPGPASPVPTATRSTAGGVVVARQPTLTQTAPPVTLIAQGQTRASAAKEPTLAPTKTLKPSPAPTLTPAPSVTPAPTAMPVPTRTAKPTAISPTAAPKRPAATSVAAPVAASTGGVTLAAPPPDTALNGRVSFEWRPGPGFALAAGEQYELVFWQPGQDGLRDGRSPVGASSQTAAVVDTGGLNQLGLPTGPLLWGVRLWGSTGAVRMLSEGRPCTYSPPGGSEPTDPNCEGEGCVK